MDFANTATLNKKVRFALLSVALVVAGAGLSACNSDPDIDITKIKANTDPADKLYAQGLANLNAGNVGEAKAKFAAIDKEDPFSEEARKALVMSTFLNYRNGQYDEAIISGNRYMKLYPESKDAAYVQYLVGLANYKKIPDVTQDQRYAAETIKAMQAVVDNYPSSEYADDARSKIRMAKDQLAGKEMQVGRYYQERKEYIAAVSRYRNVVEAYQSTNQVQEALARLVECYYAMGVTSEAQTAAAVLGANYPDSQWYADSYKLLKSGGLEPRENTGSWISRAAKKLVLGEG
ncbi:outer membrane protein assembly factor BamD [Rhizobium sp. C1]|uniref:outer membrane protein assembly factor BamD n=1 Tax=Rhizobium sp. C1 TaxID=1349799 RepID=UPI001E618A7B|nr:outer membrane protein assembly factor BamD [Rhizobium sp. C1]MCD2176555.1 outer membrane protein assembly factor BamD [Rhizobium sp. C1]